MSEVLSPIRQSLEKSIGVISLEDVVAVTGLELNQAAAAFGFQRKQSWKLFTQPNHQAKASKAAERGYLEFTLGLQADRHTYQTGAVLFELITCPHATHGENGCAGPCLVHSGHNRWDAAKAAKAKRTEWLHNDPVTFMAQLLHEIHKGRRLAEKLGLRLLIRLNTFSDLRWERIAPWIFTEVPDAIFLDYTKWPPGKRVTPLNYTLACSVQAHRHDVTYWQRVIDAGHSVSAIVDKPALLLEARPDLFVDASADDAWILRNAAHPTVGVLKPIAPLKWTHGSVYSAHQLLADGVFHTPGKEVAA